MNTTTNLNNETPRVVRVYDKYHRAIKEAIDREIASLEYHTKERL